MTIKKIGLFWFNNDLRLHDNPALLSSNSIVDELYCVFLPLLNSQVVYPPTAQTNVGHAKQQFLLESLTNLDKSLRSLAQQLIYVDGNAEQELSRLIETLNVTDIFRSYAAGYYENALWAAMKIRFPDKHFHCAHSHTLFDISDLPFSLQALPTSFTKFKNALSDQKPTQPLARVGCLPPMPAGDFSPLPLLAPANEETKFVGGEESGLVHLENYFSSTMPAHYKEVRNSISGWDNSCKFSPWLANGSLSVRQVCAALFYYEKECVANDSTYWIYFELLWREYFQWYAQKHRSRLFLLSGIKSSAPLTSYYPERFKKWCMGSTPYPIVNACMNELRLTGYLSNRGRQIAASCFVNELALDWRYGAAYFESQLIDYDVAANWGNWQYLAGVGADARDKRHFNLEKQTQIFDPENHYIEQWRGDSVIEKLDSVDAADWPIN
jgi:deoxyribodipyrimidine photo-lyase